MNDNEEEPRERLKAAVWYIVGEICESQRADLNVVITPQLVASLAEVVFAQAESLGKDLETFSKHAKRSTVNVDDVKVRVELRKCTTRAEAVRTSTRANQSFVIGMNKLAGCQEKRKFGKGLNECPLSFDAHRLRIPCEGNEQEVSYVFYVIFPTPAYRIA
ncbi:Centromere protein S [Dissophora ornata]|nr:Centromere protein S [Dissophora ornata]